MTGLPQVADVLGSARRLVVPLPDGRTAHVLAPPREAGAGTHRRIYAALVPVTSRAFGADMTVYWRQRERDGYLLRLAEFALVAAPDGTMIGWTGMHVLPDDARTLVYIDSTGMIPEWQSRGVMRTLVRDRLRALVLPPDRPAFLTARSESPVVYRLMRWLAGPVFPAAGVAVPADVRDAACALAAWLGQEHLFNPGTFVVEGAYAGLDQLYGELPTTGDAELDRLFRDRLGPLDAYLLVARQPVDDRGGRAGRPPSRWSP